MSLFKKIDVIDMLDEKIDKDENVLVEANPNKLLYVSKITKPYFILILVPMIIDIFYALFNFQNKNFIINILEILIIIINVVVLIFIAKKVIENSKKAIYAYYVITDKAVHIVEGGKSVQYNMYLYENISSIDFVKYKFYKDKGDIVINEITKSDNQNLVSQLLAEHIALHSVDDASKIFNILKQIAQVQNEDILFTDEMDDVNIDYFKEIKKYKHKIDVNKNKSLIDRRNEDD